jgi:glucose-1-phosphate thymidylyltransferase
MKGVLLAGGSGSRLRPLTLVTNKHLLPVHDRPMIYWPLHNLVMAGVTRIFVVTGGDHFSAVGDLLGSGEREDMARLGIEADVRFAYGVQKRPSGIAHALGLAAEFSGTDPVAVILGDNIFENPDFLTRPVADFEGGAHIFLKEVPGEPLYEETPAGRRAKYGIAELDGDRVVGIEEKPAKPKTNLAVTGAYLYSNDVFSIVRTLRPSGRGELEITDVNNAYIRKGLMRYSVIEGEWTDAGSLETLHRANIMAHQWTKPR